MIAHVSIPARNPRNTALFLTALMKGEAFQFPVVPGAWIAIADDGAGTAVEVDPDGMAHHAGNGELERFPFRDDQPAERAGTARGSM